MRHGRPCGSWPGINVRPTVLIAKITIRTISGTRIRRMTKKIVAEAFLEVDIGTRRAKRNEGNVTARMFGQAAKAELFTHRGPWA